MADREHLERAFSGFHMVLGLALLWGSVHTVLHLGPTDLHARIIGTIEGVGAAAFLLPATLRAGAGLLLFSLLGAILIHATQGELRPDLLVYAAGVLLVLVHGSAYRRGAGEISPA